MKRQELADGLWRGGTRTEKKWTLWEMCLNWELIIISPEMIILRRWRRMFEHNDESQLCVVPVSIQLSSKAKM